jgi:Asp-tRNA(Asn)/Glu-tRNA(Gln) amidotransferase A subunit family amidase
MEKALVDVKNAGAVLIDPALTGLDLPKTISDASAASYEVAAAINKYLSELPPTAPIRSVDEMIAKAGDVKVKANIITSNRLSSLDHDPRFAAALKHQAMIREALVALMDKYQLDALILPYRTAQDDVVGLPADSHPADVINNLAAFTGLPTIVVPGGFWPSDGMPFAVQFLGRNFSEPTLIKLASGYEAATHHRKAPTLTPPLAGESFEY